MAIDSVSKSVRKLEWLSVSSGSTAPLGRRLEDGIMALHYQCMGFAISNIRKTIELKRLSITMETNQVRSSFLHGRAGHAPNGNPYLTFHELDTWRERLARGFSTLLPQLEQMYLLDKFPRFSQETSTQDSDRMVVTSGEIFTMTHREGFPTGVFD
ncbi:hypothetical protein BGZ61DRAFT_448236 [Ilyonectria robusta]|uniref:uncharacterized protein n=1 Tax=Ilyonectria robusta TaxID=1079257 RepID=UPI001E8CE5B9|nr:uncharacterized protein BGZ61DRAFT_448236 [Ilyonectria robusta]KAH8722223.1 hypothetical protein BGZ61DRAFT_448236 [Ilyonectria robusta]